MQEELQEIKQESIEALKASRERAGVLRRGLQGSAALLVSRPTPPKPYSPERYSEVSVALFSSRPT